MILSSKVIKEVQVLGKKTLDWNRELISGRAVPGEVRTLVDGLMEQAQKQAEGILNEARSEAERIKEQAKKDGYQEGHRQGKEEGNEVLRHAALNLLEEIRESMLEWSRLGAQVSALVDDKLLAVASGLTEKILENVFQESPSLTAAYLKDLLGEVPGPSVAIYLGAAFYERVAEAGEAMTQVLGSIEVILDRHLRPWDVRLEGEQGGVLAGVRTAILSIVDEVRRGSF